MKKPEYIVDNQSRLSKIVYADKRSISYEYDDVGNLLKISDSALGKLFYKYDPVDRVTKTIYENWYEASYAYDPVGNRKQVAYPNGEAVAYNYNKNNQLTEVVSGTRKTYFEYDKAGRLVKKVLPNGVTIAYSYNAVGRLTNLVTTDSNNSILFEFSYNLDAVGNYLSIHKTAGNSSKTTRFIYDPLYRLTHGKLPNGNKIKYKYDPIGNRLLMKSVSISSNGKPLGVLSKALSALGILPKKISYQYNTGSQLLNAGGTNFIYDDKGNLIEKKAGNKTTRYSYDYEN
ncbi:MAG: hypothetical protein Q8M92_02995, partial [Candidatus Subteraquimicrobiales bacterium]|nr:hypothetical protein [Candidatus Subteraquimicrobiales bacterium]